MSENKRIESGDGDEITVERDDSHVVIGIIEADGPQNRLPDCFPNIATIWLTYEQSDELIREIGAARVEISKARPQA